MFSRFAVPCNALLSLRSLLLVHNVGSSAKSSALEYLMNLFNIRCRRRYRLEMTRPPIFPLLLLLLICFLTEVACQSVNPPGKITCYDFDGTAFNNNTQCDGSDVCCGEASQCQANRFCLKPDGQLLRPTCAFFPWSNCSPLCQFGEYVP